jgi:hypothetical protein
MNTTVPGLYTADSQLIIVRFASKVNCELNFNVLTFFKFSPVSEFSQKRWNTILLIK